MGLLVDTSVWIAGALGRSIDRDRLPDESVACVITQDEDFDPLHELGALVVIKV